MSSLIIKFFLIFSSIVIINTLPAISFEEQKKEQMIHDLEVIKYHFETGYAPAQWKNEFSGWNLDEAFEKSKKQILETPSITTKQFQIIVRNFIKSMKDYHVDVIFYSTESASLPFTVKGAEGHFFIDWIDYLRLPPSHYPVRVGDELLEFGERPIVDVINDLINENGKSANSSTDSTIAGTNLTHRKGLSGDIVPQGAIIIKTRSSETGVVSTFQISWSYTPEYVNNPFDFIPPLDFVGGLNWPVKEKQKSKVKLTLPNLTMSNPLHEIYAKNSTDRSGVLGGRKSFVPLLGETLWVKEDLNDDIDDEDSFFANINWYAYIYRHPAGPSIGYIRIPHYMGFSGQSDEFGEILNMMQEKTDALVIDQVHNFGGYVSFQYKIASMLTNKPLNTPYHRIKITQKQIIEAYSTLELIKLIEMSLPNDGVVERTSSNNEGKEDENTGIPDLGFNYQELMFLKNFHELILDQWNAGHTLTCPTPILGVDKINPHPKYRYTKPILMLIDEMDFSGGDFMAAILQDNSRANNLNAKLFGNRTAGAGGFVFTFEFPNSHGIAQCSYTASIAERSNLQKIENLGVAPDIEYQITAEDLKNGYKGYVDALNQAVLELIKNNPN